MIEVEIADFEQWYISYFIVINWFTLKGVGGKKVKSFLYIVYGWSLIGSSSVWTDNLLIGLSAD